MALPYALVDRPPQTQSNVGISGLPSSSSTGIGLPHAGSGLGGSGSALPDCQQAGSGNGGSGSEAGSGNHTGNNNQNGQGNPNGNNNPNGQGNPTPPKDKPPKVKKEVPTDLMERAWYFLGKLEKGIADARVKPTKLSHMSHQKQLVNELIENANSMDQLFLTMNMLLHQPEAF